MESATVIRACLLLLFLAGCGPKYITVQGAPELRDQPVERIAVLSLAAGVSDRHSVKKGRIDSEGPEVINGLIYDTLSNYGHLIPVSRTESEAAAATIGAELTALTIEQQARGLGEALDAPWILAGRVDIFEERVGGRYGIERPPSVGFDLVLVRTMDGAVVWRGSYYETQQPLFSDLTTFPLFMKRKGRWLTARELAQYGIHALLNRAEWLKED
jgi:hypothetical protein